MGEAKRRKESQKQSQSDAPLDAETDAEIAKIAAQLIEFDAISQVARLRNAWRRLSRDSSLNARQRVLARTQLDAAEHLLRHVNMKLRAGGSA